MPLVLEPDDARFAIVEAARQRNVSWEPEAADMVVQISGYPAHLQVFADQTWLAADGPNVITVRDADAGIKAGAETLERESLGPRFDGLTDREREFLTALALNGAHATTSELAIVLARPQKSLSDLRDALITQGDVYVPRRGELALTVPVFAPYLLANYEQARARSATTRLLPLEHIRANLEALQARQLAGAGQAPPGATTPAPPTSTGPAAARRPPEQTRRQAPRR